MILRLLFVHLLRLILVQSEVWTVIIQTGRERFAGTDSNVFIRLSNAKNEETSEYQLTHFNWQHAANEFPVRNLFEIGSRERFLIRTEDIGNVSKIYVRHDNFPWFQSDWLLDEVVLERERDRAKFRFQCNCWLRKNRPYVTVSILPDPRSLDKKKSNNSSAKYNRTFVIILIILILLVISFFCYYHRTTRQRRAPSFSFDETIEPTLSENLPPNLYQRQSTSSRTLASRSQLYLEAIRRWKNHRHSPTTNPPADSDQPPAYEDLYPNSISPINVSSNSNS